MDSLFTLPAGALPTLVAVGLKVLTAALILIIGGLSIKFGSRMIDRLLARTIQDATVRSYLMTAVRTLLWLVLIVMLLGAIGIEATSIVAVLGAAGLAIGLAVQGSLSNIAAGVMLLVFRPFTVDDEVEISGVTGKVREVGLISTIVDGADGVRAFIPNSVVFSGVIRNRAVLGMRRVEQRVRVGYGSDLERVRQLLIDLARTRKELLPGTEPTVVILEEAPNGVLLALRAQTRIEDEASLRLWLVEASKNVLRENGVAVVDGAEAAAPAPLPTGTAAR